MKDWDEDERSLKSFSFCTKQITEVSTISVSDIAKALAEDEKSRMLPFFSQNININRKIMEKQKIKIILPKQEKKPEVFVNEEYNQDIMDNQIYKKFTYS